MADLTYDPSVRDAIVAAIVTKSAAVRALLQRRGVGDPDDPVQKAQTAAILGVEQELEDHTRMLASLVPEIVSIQLREKMQTANQLAFDAVQAAADLEVLKRKSNVDQPTVIRAKRALTDLRSHHADLDGEIAAELAQFNADRRSADYVAAGEQLTADVTDEPAKRLAENKRTAKLACALLAHVATSAARRAEASQRIVKNARRISPHFTHSQHWQLATDSFHICTSGELASLSWVCSSLVETANGHNLEQHMHPSDEAFGFAEAAIRDGRNLQFRVGHLLQAAELQP